MTERLAGPAHPLRRRQHARRQLPAAADNEIAAELDARGDPQGADDHRSKPTAAVHFVPFENVKYISVFIRSPEKPGKHVIRGATLED